MEEMVFSTSPISAYSVGNASSFTWDFFFLCEPHIFDTNIRFSLCKDFLFLLIFKGILSETLSAVPLFHEFLNYSFVIIFLLLHDNDKNAFQ